MSDDNSNSISANSLDTKVTAQIKENTVPQEQYKDNGQGDKIATVYSPAGDGDSVKTKSWSIAEAERAIAATTLANPRKRLAQFGLDVSRRDDFRLKNLSRKLKVQIHSEFSHEINKGPANQRIRDFDIQSQTMRLISANANLGSYQFQKTQALPFMRKSLALSYEKVNLLKQTVSAIGGLQKALVTKLEAIKMNTAAAAPRKDSLFSRLKDAVAAKNMERVATNISNAVMGQWDARYRKYAAPLTKSLHQNMSKSGPNGGVNAVKNAVSNKLNKFRRNARDYAAQEPVASSKIDRLKRSSAKAVSGVLGRAVKFGQRAKLNPRTNGFLTKAFVGTTAKLARFNPFAIPDAEASIEKNESETTEDNSGGLIDVVKKWRLESRKAQQAQLKHIEAIREKIAPAKLPRLNPERGMRPNKPAPLPKRRSTKSVEVKGVPRVHTPSVTQALATTKIPSPWGNRTSLPITTDSKQPPAETSFFQSLTDMLAKKLDILNTSVKSGDNNRTKYEVKQEKKQTLMEKLAQKMKLRKGSYEEMMARRTGQAKVLAGKGGAAALAAAEAAKAAAARLKSREKSEGAAEGEEEEGGLLDSAWDWAKDKMSGDDEEDEDEDSDDSSSDDDDDDDKKKEKEDKKKQKKEAKDRKKYKKERRAGQTKSHRGAVRERAKRLHAARKARLGGKGSFLKRSMRGAKGLAGKGLGSAKGLAGKGLKGLGGLAGKGVKGLGGLALSSVTGGDASAAKGIKGLGGMALNGAKGLATSGLAKAGVMTVGKGLLSAGAGMGVGLVAEVADQYVDTMDDGWKKRAAKTATMATKYGAMGASVGALFGGVGAAPGAAIGAAVGAVVANADIASSALNSMASGAKAAVGGLWSSIFGSEDELNKDGTVGKKGKPSLLQNMHSFFFGDKAKYDTKGKLLTALSVVSGGAGLVATAGFKAAAVDPTFLPQSAYKSKGQPNTSDPQAGPLAKKAAGAQAVKLAGDPKNSPASAENLPYFMAAATTTMGVSNAVLGWSEDSGYIDSPTSPYYAFVSEVLGVYGIRDRKLYKLVHSLELSQEKANSGATKPFDDGDLAYIASRFGFDIRNKQALDYFKLWHKRRFVPGMAMIGKVLRANRLTFASVLGATTEELEKLTAELKKEIAGSQIKAVGLEPSIEAFNKYSKIGGAEPNGLPASTQNSATPFDPRNPSNQENPTDPKNNFTANAIGGMADRIGQAFGIQGLGQVVSTFMNMTGGQGNGGSPFGASQDGSYNEPAQAARKNALMAKGDVKDQPEFKAALAKLPPNLQKAVMKSNPLQFVLWSTAVQHGPDVASQIFQRDYSDQLDDRGNIRAIYQDRSTRFGKLNSDDRGQAISHLGEEERFALGITDGTSSLTRGAFGAMVNNTFDPEGNYNYGSASPENIKGDVAARAKQAIAFFMSKGYRKEAAVGIVANLMHESGVQAHPRGSNDGGRAHGVAQWHPDRQSAIAKQFGKRVQNMNLMEQLAAVDWEMKTGHGVTGGKNLAEMLNRASNAGQAAVTVMQQYERPADNASNGPNARARAGAAMGLMRTVGDAMPNPPQTQPTSRQPSSSSNSSSAGSIPNKAQQVLNALGYRSTKPITKAATLKAPVEKGSSPVTYDPTTGNMGAFSKSLDRNTEALLAFGKNNGPTNKTMVNVSPTMGGQRQGTTPGFVKMDMSKARHATGLN